MWYNNEKYVLIDCEKGKDIVNSGDFNIEGRVCETDCIRGYIAEYFIEEFFLYGKKTTEQYFQNQEGKLESKWVISEKTKLSYTGSAVIAISETNRYLPLMSVSDYLYYDRAFELYFVDGELCEATDLSESIKYWKKVKSDNDSLNFLELRSEFSGKYLNYEYGANYK